MMIDSLWQNEAQIQEVNSSLSREEKAKAIRNNAKKTIVAGERLGLLQGELLHTVYKEGFWEDWGYDSFESYVEQELQFRRRKAYYLIQLYEKFCVELDLPIERIKELDWSKVKELLPVIDKDNAETWLDYIKGKSVREVKEAVKTAKGELKESMNTLTLKLTDEQKENVQNAFNMAQRLTGSDVQGHLVDTIMTEYLSQHAEDSSVKDLLDDLNYYLKSIERAFGVTLEVKETDSSKLPAVDEE